MEIQNLIAAVTYTISTYFIFECMRGYLVSFRMRRSIPVLSWIIFLLSVWIIILITTIKLWGIYLFGHHIDIPTTAIRPILLMISSGFLYYTVWIVRT